jgi:hypothetical protein
VHLDVFQGAEGDQEELEGLLGALNPHRAVQRPTYVEAQSLHIHDTHDKHDTHCHTRHTTHTTHTTHDAAKMNHGGVIIRVERT